MNVSRSYLKWRKRQRKLSIINAKQARLEKNIALIQKNINFSTYKRVVKVSELDHGNIYQDLGITFRVFFPTRYSKYFRQHIFQKTKVRKIAEQFLRYTAFSRSNSLDIFNRSWELTWPSEEAEESTQLVLDMIKFFKDDDPEKERWSSDESEENSDVENYYNPRHFVITRSWRTWKLGFLRKRRSIYNFLEFYRALGRSSIIRLYEKHYIIKTKDFTPIYYIYWTFTATHRLYINMRNRKDVKYNYLSLSTGLFLKFYKNRRPLKRTKLFKVLLVKYLRKLLIVSGLRDFFVIVNRSPMLFAELFKVFMTPNITPFRIPGKKRLYDDSALNSTSPTFNIHRFLFFRTKAHALMKIKKRGRLKRKITKRLIKKNSVID